MKEIINFTSSLHFISWQLDYTAYCAYTLKAAQTTFELLAVCDHKYRPTLLEYNAGIYLELLIGRSLSESPTFILRHIRTLVNKFEASKFPILGIRFQLPENSICYTKGQMMFTSNTYNSSLFTLGVRRLLHSFALGGGVHCYYK